MQTSKSQLQTPPRKSHSPQEQLASSIRAVADSEYLRSPVLATRSDRAVVAKVCGGLGGFVSLAFAGAALLLLLSGNADEVWSLGRRGGAALLEGSVEVIEPGVSGVLRFFQSWQFGLAVYDAFCATTSGPLLWPAVDPGAPRRSIGLRAHLRERDHCQLLRCGSVGGQVGGRRTSASRSRRFAKAVLVYVLFTYVCRAAVRDTLLRW